MKVRVVSRHVRRTYIQAFINESWLTHYSLPLKEDGVKLIWSLTVSIYSLGALLGSICAGHLSVRLGRKKCMLYNNIPALMAALLMGFSKMAGSFEMIILARFIYGYNVGVGLNIHIMYLSECSPKRLRGAITVTSATCIALGKFVGQMVGLREVLGTENLWPVLLALNGLPALIQLITLPFFPESPRYLLINKGEKEKCMKAIQRLWGAGDYQEEMDDMLAEQAAFGREKPKSIWELFTDQSVRWQTITLVVIYVFMQLCGVNTIYMYAFSIFKEAGVSPGHIQYINTGTGITEIITTSMCGYFTERFGRRPLLWMGYGVMGLIMGLLTITLSFQDSISWIPSCSIVLIFSFIICFGLGPSGVVASLQSELFMQTYRPAGYMVGGAGSWAGLFLIAMIFPFLIDLLGQFCFLIFLAYCVTASVFVYLFLPETKGKSMLEIWEDFNKLNFRGKSECMEPQLDKIVVIATRL
nr:PREDICTED: solute carrier family 2, facilitated glucose transporter member 11-like [Latimeria chalumnae]|eukprot:XP_014344537.1 PREDICTED: solute carrier family 2, facilitated glucose transporter member 11-like [Latimeria chalumnae]